MLESRLMKYINELIARYPSLNVVSQEIQKAYSILEECYMNGGKLLAAGNGGSAADSEHIVGELMKRFMLPRPVEEQYKEKLKAVDPIRGDMLARHLERSFMALSLISHEALFTAAMNDIGGMEAVAQQLFGYGQKGDVFLGISTSGNSENIIQAAVVAKASSMKVIGLTGNTGGELARLCDVAVCVPGKETYLIQELHLPIYHCWCLMLEDKFFGG